MLWKRWKLPIIITHSGTTAFLKDGNAVFLFLSGRQVDEWNIVFALSHEVNHWAHWHNVRSGQYKMKDIALLERAANWGLAIPIRCEHCGHLVLCDFTRCDFIKHGGLV